MTLFRNPFGDFKLVTLYHHPRSPLQAWNAADELILNHLAKLELTQPRSLIVNDTYGALMLSLNCWQPESWNDSVMSYQAWQANAARNKVVIDQQLWLPSTAPLNNQYDLVVFKIPKTLSLLEHQLHQLKPFLKAESIVVAGGMIKHLSKAMIAAFEQIIGPTTTSLAEKKARLVFAKTNTDQKSPNRKEATQYTVPNTPIQLHNEPHVFSQRSLDQGTALLLAQIPAQSGPGQIIDLGCGNGALGCYAAWKNPLAKIHFVDESYLAIKSAQSSWESSKLTNDHAFYPNNGLQGLALKADLILCNPPFHAGNRLDDQIALRLFKDAKHSLLNQGKLLVVGNRHLNYHHHLSKYFKQVSVIASNRKFVVFQASAMNDFF